MKTYRTAFAFRRALEDRLAAAAKSERIDLRRMRRQVAFDRLLARLLAEGNPPCRLKGGYALEPKLAVARSTRDLDLGLSALHLSPMDLVTALQDAASMEANDFFIYQIGEPIMELDGAPYGGSRHPVEAHLDGRLFARFHLVVGLGDIQQEPYEWIDSRDWLGFAGISAGRFPTISREEHFAQKLHVYTLPRGERANTRVKDLIDLVLLIDSGTLDMDRLCRDITVTFARWETHALPGFLESPPDFWEPVFVKLAAECGIDGNIHAQFDRVIGFFERLIDVAEILNGIEAVKVGLDAAETRPSNPALEAIRD